MALYEFWTIECRTGCSCCSNEDHYYGLHCSEAAANEEMARLSRNQHVRSQFSENGRYKLVKKLGKIYLPYSNLHNDVDPHDDSRLLVLFGDDGFGDIFTSIVISTLDVINIAEGNDLFSPYFRKAL